MEILLGWLFLSVVVAVLASGRGRSGLGWFLISAILSPLIAAVAVLVLPKKGDAAAPLDELGRPITAETHVRCPDCKELVRREASKCKHCAAALIPQ